MKYVYGPIPSRRLGKSLGISPISKKTCNLSCVYCQLGLTDKMTNNYTDEYPVEAILSEVKEVVDSKVPMDVITIVGEGEPTLYRYLNDLIDGINSFTEIPIAVITNGTRFTEVEVYKACLKADIVLPSIDAYDEASFKKINRPHRSLNYDLIVDSLIRFSHEYQGKLWLETMICEGYNDSSKAVEGLKTLLKRLKYEKYYLNSPVRPPAVKSVKPVSHEKMDEIAKILKGINIDMLADPNFFSNISDNYEAILSIIRRHPMNRFEIQSFLDSRKEKNSDYILSKLEKNTDIEVINYKTFDTFRFRMGR